jgi:hypothetical protein
MALSTLFGRAPKDSYQELLKLNNTGAGVDGTLRSVLDGAGNATPLQVSSTQVSLNGSVWPTAAGSTGQFLSVGASGLQWTSPSGLTYTGTWNATTNTPQLTSGSGTTGAMYKVSTAGTTLSIGIPHGISGSFNSYQLNSTTGLSLGMGVTDSSSSTFLGIIININPGVGITVDRTVSVVTGGPFSFTSYLDGITTFSVGDYVFFDGTAWERVAGAGSAPVQSVFGRTGAVTLQSADVTTALGFTPANTASPALTGTPTAPTATAGTNTTQIATTAFVTTAVTAGTGSNKYASNIATTSATTVAMGNLYTCTSAGYTMTLPALSGTTNGQIVTILNGATSGTITIAITGSDKLWGFFGPQGGVTSMTLAAGESATFVALPAQTAWDVIDYTRTVVSPTFTGRVQSDAYSYTVSALGSISGTKTLDLSSASEFTATITGATTFAFTNTLAANIGQVVYLRLTNAGSANITWPASTKFAGGTAPAYTTSGVDLFGVMYDVTTSTYMVFVIGLNIL